jgi:cystathionine gamma-synthase
MDEAARQRAGIGAGLLRVSVGIEAPEDLVADLSAGLARALACTPVRAASATAAQVA